jgi:hypothetical protein
MERIMAGLNFLPALFATIVMLITPLTTYLTTSFVAFGVDYDGCTSLFSYSPNQIKELI